MKIWWFYWPGSGLVKFCGSWSGSGYDHSGSTSLILYNVGGTGGGSGGVSGLQDRDYPTAAASGIQIDRYIIYNGVIR